MSTSIDRALVLGGTRGLGERIADELERRGVSVTTVGRSQGRSDARSDDRPTGRVTGEAAGGAHATRLGQTATEADHDRETVRCDLNDLASVEGFVAAMDRRSFSDFYWVAGVLKREPFVTIAGEDILRMTDVNFRNPLLIAQRVWSQMAARRSRGRFVVVASTAGLAEKPRDDEAIYAATKAAQIAFARAIGHGNRNEFVQTSLFCPGGMQTEFWSPDVVGRETFLSFLDPRKVAARILTLVHEQSTSYAEHVIPRGSL